MTTSEHSTDVDTRYGSDTRTVTLRVNGREITREVATRTTLADFLRDDLDLVSVHLGCEHGVCGCCTIMLDDRPVRSCLMLAVQANGAAITTIEGLAEPDGSLHEVQQAIGEASGLQCGFCTPGFAMTILDLIERSAPLDDDQIREGLAGNLCRCTGYDGLVQAVRMLSDSKKKGSGDA